MRHAIAISLSAPVDYLWSLARPFISAGRRCASIESGRNFTRRQRQLLGAVFLFSIYAAPTLAQQPPADPAFLQQALVALQGQRNRALDEAAVAQAQAAKMQADLAAVTKERDELKAKLEPKPDK